MPARNSTVKSVGTAPGLCRSRARFARAGVTVRERQLVPQPLDKRHPDLAAIQVAGDIEEVGLDHRTGRPEGRADADVGHRRVDLPVNQHGRGIHTVGGEQLVLSRQIRSREPQLPSAALTAGHRAPEHVVVPQQRPGLIDPALDDEPSDTRAAHHELAVAHRSIFSARNP